MRKKGSISVFLVLLLTVISGFIIRLTGAVRGSVSKSEAVLAVDDAIRSCFAEYNRKLFERYHILLIDSSYKGEEKGEDRVLDHFTVYLENSISQNMICDTRIEGYKSARDNDGEYIYRQGAEYAGKHLIPDGESPLYDDGKLFRTYLVCVLGDHFCPNADHVREGETEYLIYGNEDDEDNIMEALSEHGEYEDMTYGDFLSRKLDDMEDGIIRTRFLDLVTEYMRDKGSPGFDPKDSYYSLTFKAVFENERTGEYSVTRTYSYEET